MNSGTSAEGTSHPEPPAATLSTIGQAVRMLLHLDDRASLDPTASLTALGLDSLKQVELIVLIEELMQLELPDELLVADNFRSLHALASAIGDLVGSGPR